MSLYVLYICLSSFFKLPLFIQLKSQRLADCNTSKSINALVAAADYLHRVYFVAYPLNCTRLNLDISVRLDPVQVTGDPGEASRVFQLTTSCGSK